MAGAFDLTTPRELLAKLGRELERLRAAPNDIDNAFNFFVTAEHLPDWLHPGNQGKARRKAIRDSELVLQVVSHLASGAKHFDHLNEHHQTAARSGVRHRHPNPMMRRIFTDVLGAQLTGDAVAALGTTWISALDLATLVHTYWTTPGRIPE